MNDKDLRNSFLRWLYTLKVFCGPGIDYREYGKESSLENMNIKRILGSLVERELIEKTTTGSKYCLSLYGISIVEDSLGEIPEVIEIRSQRIKCLRELKYIDDNNGGYIEKDIIGEKFNLDEYDMDFIIFYLKSKKYIEGGGMNGPIYRITETGKRVLEDENFPL